MSPVSPEVGGDTEDQNQHGIVDVETISDERDNVHGSHDLKEEKQLKQVLHTSTCITDRTICSILLRGTYRGVGCLFLLLLRDGRVHVDQTQEVQTQRRC